MRQAEFQCGKRKFSPPKNSHFLCHSERSEESQTKTCSRIVILSAAKNLKRKTPVLSFSAQRRISNENLLSHCHSERSEESQTKNSRLSFSAQRRISNKNLLPFCHSERSEESQPPKRKQTKSPWHAPRAFLRSVVYFFCTALR